ncbi:TlpA family protein disulfide reductase [Mucilaginibacter ginsenosidivorans]|uniref:Redoxin domain-containing protein n=1 Tax=Mucilaginibacter ginsenosidivorans TaxID=398053 RepID=A0A5B8V410_9SPHI|nr:redoxin family protein [Mucilaginibacter ginsenosidivorans]QEC65441.1 redoxin domain-containing protein [Mucilaginibacter ginsenosidivorans]
MRSFFTILLACLLTQVSVAQKKAVKKRAANHLPDIEVYDLSGTHTTLGALAKNKVMFIDNWFIPCPPCFREMDMLHKLYFKYKANRNVSFITICRTDSGIVKKFIAKDKSLTGFRNWYEEISGRKDFKLPVYFIPGCNQKIYTGTALAKYTPDDKTKCPDAQFRFQGYPTIIIFDKAGKMIFKRTGFGLNENPDIYMAQLDSVIRSAK